MSLKQVAFFYFLFLALSSFGQSIFISGVSKRAGYPGEKITISGAGFNSIAAQNLVWFGQVEGKVISSTAFNIEVEVPAHSTFNNIEVTNLQSRLSAKTSFRFLPYFSGRDLTAPVFQSFPYTLGSDAQQIFNNAELMDLCSCDFNGDKKPDLVSSSFNDQNLLILKNESTAKNLIFRKQMLNVQAPSDKIICNDLNGDGKPELIFSRSSASSNLFVVTIFLNTSTSGNISFSGNPIQLQLPDREKDKARFLAARDLNEDGKPELIVSNINNSGSFFVFVNKSAGALIQFENSPLTFTIPGALDVPINGLSVEDLDGDRKPDIVVSKYQAGTIYILKNTSSSTVSLAEPLTVNLANKFINKLAVGDLNNDGLTDIVMTDFFGGEVIYLLNTTQGGKLAFGSPAFVSLKISSDVDVPGPDGLDIGDINGDKKPDIVVSIFNKDRIAILLGDGLQNVKFAPNDVRIEKFSRNVLLADMDGDAKPDLNLTSFNKKTVKFSLDILRNLTCYSPQIVSPSVTDKPLAICVGQSITLKTIPSFGVTYQWNKDGAVLSTTTLPELIISDPGNYYVTALGDGAACTESSPNYLVVADQSTIPASPIIIGPTEVCENSNFELKSSDVSDATFLWFGPDGRKLPGTSSTLQVSNANLNAAGSYSVQIQKGECRTEIVSKTIDVVSLGTFEIKSGSISNTICTGQSLTLSVGSLSNFIYQWRKDSQVIPAANLATLAASDPGIYTVNVDYSAIANCSRLITPGIEIKVFEKPNTSFITPEKTCLDVPVTFENKTTFPQGAPAAIYSWSFGAGKISSKANPDAVTFTDAGSISITLSVGYQGITGCEQRVSKILQVVQPVKPEIISSVVETCPEQLFELTLRGAFKKILWNTGLDSIVLKPNQPGTYSVTTTDENGCVSTDSISVPSKQVPQVIASSDKQNVFSGEKVQLSATGADSWLWLPSEILDDSTIFNPIATLKKTTTFIVKGTLTGACFSRDSVTINVLAESGFPNIFSPNGDGNNDTWVLDGITSFPDCFLTIFERSGRRVFEAKSYNNDWDGTHDGKPLPEGVYYYVLGCPGRPPTTGTILIAR